MFHYREIMDNIIEEGIAKGNIVGANLLFMQHGRELHFSSQDMRTGKQECP